MSGSKAQHRDPGEVPVLDWIEKGMIDIDPTYQRGLDEARVLRILESFAWDSFGAIVIAPVDYGRYHCIDGQHRLEAAKRHPMVGHVPAVIIARRTVEGEAETFVAVNRDRKNVTPLDLYWAELAASDPEAVTVSQVVDRAGIAILRHPPSNGAFKVRETVAIGALRSLIDRRGAMRARIMLDVLAGADLKPIKAHQIKAAETLLTDPEYADQVDAEALTESLSGAALALDDEASVFAATHRVPLWKALASVWFRKTRKKRRQAA